MLTSKNIVLLAAVFGIGLTGVSAIFFGLPGMLLGAIFGFFGAQMMAERLRNFLPENRRRMRRMARNEGQA